MTATDKIKNILAIYSEKAESRMNSFGLAPRPLDEAEVKGLFDGLRQAAKDGEDIEGKLLEQTKKLLKDEVRRGSYPSSEAKAAELDKIIRADEVSVISKEEALDMLLDMNGGAADKYMAAYHGRDDIDLEKVGHRLENIFFISKEAFDELYKHAKGGSKRAAKVIENWANRNWEKYENFPNVITKFALKTGDYITTGHLSPSKHAGSRTDKPKHGLYIMEGRDDEPNFIKRAAEQKAKGGVCVVGGEGFGEGSSRKSATYSLLEVIGEPAAGEPEKKNGGVLIAKSIAPIFENSIIASGIIPLKANTDAIDEGDELEIKLDENTIFDKTKGISISFQALSEFTIKKLKAGGMNAYMAKKQLYERSKEAAKELGVSFKEEAKAQFDKAMPPQTLMQKIFTHNRLDGKPYTQTGESVELKIRGVFSQDTTGPMTFDEYLAMSGGPSFQSGFVIQSVCHTGECPTSEERDTQRYLQNFSRERGGIGLRVGEGVIHTIGNRFVLPTDVIVGGDSHTRSERGASFPAGSDIVAAAMKYGMLEINADEEVRVDIKGELSEGVTARDLASMTVLQAEKDGLGKGVYNGRVIEFSGMDGFNRDERYILTNSVAERSASAGLIPADDITIKSIEKDLKYLRLRYENGDRSSSLLNTIEAFEQYLSAPFKPHSDEGAKYAARLTIDLGDYKEPLLAKPHHPDNVAALSEVAGTKLDEVFIGSCVGGDIGSIRAAALLVEGKLVPEHIHFVVIPASEDIYRELSSDGTLKKLADAGAVIGVPGCGLCMGNKRRIGENAVALTTTTRNFKSRIGPASSQTYLGSAHVAALSALAGEIVGLDMYMQEYKQRIAGREEQIFSGV